MSDVIAATPREVTNRRSVGDWVQIIRADLRQSVEGIVTAGQHLEEAKHQVDHGEWALLLDNIGIKGSKARKFRAIGRHPVISNRSYWNTCYCLVAAQKGAAESSQEEIIYSTVNKAAQAQCFARHFLIIEMKNFAPDDLIVLVSFAGN